MLNQKKVVSDLKKIIKIQEKIIKAKESEFQQVHKLFIHYLDKSTEGWSWYGIKGAVFHDCRRNALTDFMRVHKLNVPETMRIAGHSDPRMLLRIYNNLEAHHVAKKLNS